MTDLDVPSEASPASSLDVAATITNTGTDDGTTTVTYEFAGEVEEVTIDLDAGTSRTIEFDTSVPDDEGEYQHTVSTPDDSESVTITVDEADAGDETERSDDEADAGADSDDSIPGFGVVATLGAVGVIVGVTYLRRQHSHTIHIE